ncbi:TPA: TetR family transcriptional regulator, partial [Yersinia enterocolitica]
MAYLNREERHDTILRAAMRVAITEGMNATTVRRVASEA